ncbi:MAG: FkbM family methyltransferase [Promethearchaeota archaeon]
MRNVFFNKYLAKLYHRVGEFFIIQLLIKIILTIHSTDNIYIKKIKNEITRVSIKNIYYWKILHSPKKEVESEFLDFIKEKISEPRIILDLGSRDAMQSIEFSIIYPGAKIFAFECNPPGLKKCRDNVVNLENIEIVPKAVYNKNGKIKFYSVVSNNIGGSSLFKYKVKGKPKQKEIEVDAIRIDTWAKNRGIDKIDLCWMDLQGAEYEALEGMGDLIFNVQALFVEVELQEIFSGQKLFNDLTGFLKQKGFTMIKYHSFISNWWGNAIFLNDKLIENN